jgi:protein TonB
MSGCINDGVLALAISLCLHLALVAAIVLATGSSVVRTSALLADLVEPEPPPAPPAVVRAPRPPRPTAPPPSEAPAATVRPEPEPPMARAAEPWPAPASPTPPASAPMPAPAVATPSPARTPVPPVATPSAPATPAVPGASGISSGPAGAAAPAAEPGAPAPPPRALSSAPGAAPRSAAAGPAVAALPPDGITRRPVPLHRYKYAPTYPSSARHDEIEGTTLLEVQVARDGRVTEIVVKASAGHPDLDRAAAAAVRRWRFEPARRGAEPVAMTVEIPVEFRLR